MFKENLTHIGGKGSFYYDMEKLEMESRHLAPTEREKSYGPLYNAIKMGVNARIRPVMMTALMAAIGLLPAALSHGIGSESSRPLARVVIGGILSAMTCSLWVFPLIFGWAYRNFQKKEEKQEDPDEDATEE